ncbi:DUF423 domain-containing protein [Neolewinella aurantiaca]|uniref:DUF423 domain-containing protein n=1 Tax=Neolewinella aurantiaca TaxID=2602767 RepID=A0A5C7FU51_9BACT|nr:DUF423 domain-containing protein [Neolewinella aurantiaca]TXF91684.1 DUF423 domain-containing protein [Neolewinella aurantiaca]
MKNLLRLTALLGALAVAIGAFGAHGLKEMVSAEYLETFRTGVTYQFYHVLAMGGAIALSALPGISHHRLRQAVWCWAVGILLFSGSLYLLSLREVISIPVAVLGPITPLGGLFFIVGWVLLLLAPSRNFGADA